MPDPLSFRICSTITTVIGLPASLCLRRRLAPDRRLRAVSPALPLSLDLRSTQALVIKDVLGATPYFCTFLSNIGVERLNTIALHAPCSDRSQQAADMKEGHPKLDRPDTVAFNQMQVERWCAVGKSSCNIKPDLASDFVVDGSVGPSIE